MSTEQAHTREKTHEDEIHSLKGNCSKLWTGHHTLPIAAKSWQVSFTATKCPTYGRTGELVLMEVDQQPLEPVTLAYGASGDEHLSADFWAAAMACRTALPCGECRICWAHFMDSLSLGSSRLMYMFAPCSGVLVTTLLAINWALRAGLAPSPSATAKFGTLPVRNPLAKGL